MREAESAATRRESRRSKGKKVLLGKLGVAELLSCWIWKTQCRTRAILLGTKSYSFWVWEKSSNKNLTCSSMKKHVFKIHAYCKVQISLASLYFSHPEENPAVDDILLPLVCHQHHCLCQNQVLCDFVVDVFGGLLFFCLFFVILGRRERGMNPILMLSMVQVRLISLAVGKCHSISFSLR